MAKAEQQIRQLAQDIEVAGKRVGQTAEQVKQLSKAQALLLTASRRDSQGKLTSSLFVIEELVDAARKLLAESVSGSDSARKNDSER